MPRTSVVVCALIGACAAVVVAQDDSSNKTKDPQSVYVRDSAVASEKLALAERMEHLKEWQKSADVYQEIVQKYADRVLPSHTNDDGQPTQYVSVALVVQEKIAKWPAEGLAVYRQRFEDTARDLLNSAPDDRATWQRVMTEYFVTDAGRDAGLKLMAEAFERGEFAAAVWTGTRLLNLHPGLIAERPAVLFETALAAHLGGNDAAAKPWVDELQSRFPNSTGTVRGVDVRLAETLAHELKTQPAIVSAYTSDNWPTPFGTPDAAAIPQQISAGGAKLFSIDLPAATGRGGRSQKMYQQQTARDRQIGAMTGILPAIDDGAMFFQDNVHVFAIDLASGLPLPGWQQTYPGDKHGAFGIDARPTPVGKQLGVVVHGSSVVAILGQPTNMLIDPGVNEAAQPAQLVSLDRTSGRRNWAITLPRLKLPNELATLHEAAFYGTPIVTGDSVYVLAHASRGGQFEECYLLSLKLSDGSFQWSSYIASTSANSPLIDLDENGRISSGMTAQVAMADDRLYVLTNQGAVACLDASDGKTLWLDLYPRNVSPPRARQPFLRSEQTTKPFAINPPIVSGGRVFVMPSDSGSVLVYDANTGDTIATLPRKLDMKYEPADMLLAAVGDRVVMGNRSMVFVAPWRSFDPLKSLLENGGMYRNFTASDAAESDAIRGRPFVSEKYVLIPTADKLYRMTLNQFKFESVYPAEGKWDDDESPGNVVATPDNLIIAGPTRVTAYADLTVATAKLDTRIAANPEDVEAYLHYGELLFAAGRPLDAIGRLDQAIAHMGGAGKLTSGPLRDRLFEILCTAATKVQKNDTPSPQVLSELFDRAKLAAATPQQQVQYRLTQAAYFRKTGDTDAEIALDQQILADPALRSASASDKNGMSTAGAIAENAINELIQLHGQQVYAAYESQAYQRLTAAKQATAVDPETLLAIADEFPASQQALDALTLASDRFEQLHEPRQATQTLRRLLKRGLSNERKLLVLEALARNYLAVPNQLDMAIVRLRQAKAITADAKLDRPLTLGDGRTLNDMTLAQAVVMLQQYRDTAIKASLPRVGLVATADGGDPGKPVFATPIDLGPAASVVRQQDDLGRNDRVVVLTPDNSIVAYDTTSAKPLMLPVAFGETPLGCGYVGNTLVVIGPTHAVAIDAGGKTVWQVALSSLPAVEVAAPVNPGDPTDASDDADDPSLPPNVQAAIRRGFFRGGRIGRWPRNIPPAVDDAPDEAPPQSEQFIKYQLLSDRLLLGSSSGRVVALDLGSGKSDWQARFQDLPVRHFLATEDFMAVSYTDGGTGSDVYALDTLSGRVVLHNSYVSGQGNWPTTLMNLALSPDGVLVTMQGGRLLGRDLYDLSTPPWTYNAIGASPLDTPYIASGGDNQLVISDDTVLAVYRSANNVLSVRPYDLRTLQPKTFHDDRLNRDINITYASHAATDRDSGIVIVAAGPSVYLFGAHSLAAYNLNHRDPGWNSGSAAADDGVTREFIVAQDYAVQINQLASPNLDAPRVPAIKLAFYDRTVTASGVESGLKDRVATLRDPASFAAEQWQLVDGAFTYVSGDRKLKLLRVNPGK